ncbi:MAG TPA: ABC transporter permease subunit, partial [Holophaga sp.]|nr:ABC transporter permease subunit [Holophaga sp.]
MAPIPKAAGGPRVVQRKPWASWALALLLLLALGKLVQAGVRVRILDVHVFARYLFSREVLVGAGNTLLLGTLALLLALVLGLPLALMRLSRNGVLKAFAAGYVYLFRGTPLLIQVIFWFNAFPTMFPRVTLAVPFTGTVLLQRETASLVTPFLAALLALALAETAYMGEIIRGGIQAVDAGQREAGKALGMSTAAILRHVVV